MAQPGICICRMKSARVLSEKRFGIERMGKPEFGMAQKIAEQCKREYTEKSITESGKIQSEGNRQKRGWI